MEETIKIIQLTDMHLSKNNAFIFDVDTNLAYEKIIRHIQMDLTDADAVFLTGDLSQDETIESYERIMNSLKDFSKPVFWIPGNHDSIENMALVFNRLDHFSGGGVFTTPVWDFIFINTKIDGKESGFISDNEFWKVSLELKKERTKPVALVMHHHPAEVKTPLIDSYILENRAQFFKIIDKSNVNLIICGHVHNDYSFRYNNICIEAGPSTGFQFKKGSTELEIDTQIGYKIYYFSSNKYVTETKAWPG